MVHTPQGIGTIVDWRRTETWVFGRPRRRWYAVVKFPGGRRHLWALDKLEAYDASTQS